MSIIVTCLPAIRSLFLRLLPRIFKFKDEEVPIGSPNIVTIGRITGRRRGPKSTALSDTDELTTTGQDAFNDVELADRNDNPGYRL